MRLAGSALGVALAIFGPPCARAGTVTYIATGVVGAASLDLRGQFPIGQPFTYTFTLDTAIPDSDPSAFRGFYVNGLTSSSGSIGTYHFSTGAGNLEITNAFMNDSFSIFSRTVTGLAAGVDTLAAIGFILADTTGTAFSSDAVPLSLNLPAFNHLNKLNPLFFKPDNTIVEVIAGVREVAVSESISQTPIPAAFPLFATGLGALGLLSWWKRKAAAIRA